MVAYKFIEFNLWNKFIEFYSEFDKLCLDLDFRNKVFDLSSKRRTSNFTRCNSKNEARVGVP